MEVAYSLALNRYAGQSTAVAQYPTLMALIGKRILAISLHFWHSIDDTWSLI